MPKIKIMMAIAKRGFYRTALVRGRGRALNTNVHVLKRNDSCRKRQIEQLNVVKKQIGKNLLERHHVRTASSITIDPHRPDRHLSCRLHRVIITVMKTPSSKEGRQTSEQNQNQI